MRRARDDARGRKRCRAGTEPVLYLRKQVFSLPHFVDQLSDDASVQYQVMEEQVVTWGG